MQRLRRIVLPLAAGLAVLVAALVVPFPHVHGTTASGPARPREPAPAWHGRPISVQWIDRHSRIALQVRWGRECPPRLAGETSTAPARIEVDLRLRYGAACQLHPRTTRFLLRPPTVAEPGQGVSVLVDYARFELPRYAR